MQMGPTFLRLKGSTTEICKTRKAEGKVNEDLLFISLLKQAIKANRKYV